MEYMENGNVSRVEIKDDSFLTCSFVKFLKKIGKAELACDLEREREKKMETEIRDKENMV